MASKLFLPFIALAAIARIVVAEDPDILTDFLSPFNQSLDGNFFTFTGMRVLVTAPLASNFTVLKATAKEFPALLGQSVSTAVLQFPAGSVNPPHTHPRSSELLFLILGTLEVGFVDTTNKVFAQKLQVGDVFVFPKGLVHYQYNSDPKQPAMALSAFGSAAAGTAPLPTTLFTSGIDDTILAKAFKTDVATIEAFKTGLGA